MPSSNNGPRPSFFRQGLMIVLPVTVLAVVGLFSLRQDEQAAEQAARKRASEDAQSLARAMGDMAGEELQQFLTLQNVWMIDLNLESQPSASMSPDKDLEAGIAKWERAYPGFRLAALAEPECDLLSDGRQIAPPEVPATPSPPKWFCDLSPKQKDLWEALRQNPGTVPDQDFLDTNPSDEARQAALAVCRPPEQMLYENSSPPTETGISFEDLACLPVAQRGNALVPSAPGYVVASPLRHAVVCRAGASGTDRGADQPRGCLRPGESPADAPVLGEPMRGPPVRRAAAQAAGNPVRKQELVLGALESDPVRSRPLLLQPVPFQRYIRTRPLLSGQGWIISFVPDQVLEAIFARALAENQFLVPDYAVADISIEGEALSAGGGHARPGEKSLLAVSAPRKFGPASIPEAASLSVSFYLTSREKMLSAEQRRTRLFGALIGAAVLAALAGLLAARRAFYAQHRLSEMKTNFVSSVSHELRAPIASMRLLSESLERGKISDAGKQQEYYRFLVQESRRLTSLIENVLDFSRIEQGRKEYQREPADLDAIVEDTIKLMRPGAAEKQVALARRPLIGPGPLVSCDGLALQQALINLIDNAIKHSPPGAKVEVGLEDGAPNGVRLWVEDQGPGIPPEEHEKIFERFYRRGSELRRETQGIGIGLTIVKHIVEAHGGRVLVRSAVGQGSRFTIQLPAASEQP